MVVDDLQRAFEARVRDLAGQYARGELSLRDWHTRMNSDLRLYLTMQHLEGTKGARVGLVQLNQEVRRQQAYLSRFADEIAIATLRDKPLSEAAIASRATLYSGAGRGLFHRAVESVGPSGSALFYEYIALDDARTCLPCLQAEGIYAGGQGPMPGEVCLGRGSCRCRRVQVPVPVPRRSVA